MQQGIPYHSYNNTLLATHISTGCTFSCTCCGAAQGSPQSPGRSMAWVEWIPAVGGSWALRQIISPQLDIADCIWRFLPSILFYNHWPAMWIKCGVRCLDLVSWACQITRNWRLGPSSWLFLQHITCGHQQLFSYAVHWCGSIRPLPEQQTLWEEGV